MSRNDSPCGVGLWGPGFLKHALLRVPAMPVNRAMQPCPSWTGKLLPCAQAGSGCLSGMANSLAKENQGVAVLPLLMPGHANSMAYLEEA